MVTKAEYFDQIASICAFLENTYSNANSQFLVDLKTVESVLKGNFFNSVSAVLSSQRRQMSGVISFGSSLLTPVLVELAKVHYSGKSLSAAAALDDIAKGLEDDSENIKSRALTFGAIAPGVNSGNGTFLRSVVDRYGYQVENTVVGSVAAVVSADRHSGRSRGNESFRIEGIGEVKTDEIEIGNTPSSAITLDCILSSQSVLQNSSFENFSGSAGGSDFELDSWEISSQSLIDSHVADFFRPAPGGDDGTALKFLADAWIEQTLPSASVSLDLAKPVYLVVRYNRQVGSATGTLTIRVGTQTESVVLLAQTGWNEIILGLDTKGWYPNFKENNLGDGVRVKVELTGSTGFLLLDDLIFRQPTAYNGYWMMVVAGQDDWLLEDEFSWTDIEGGSPGRIQKWLARVFNRYLPSTAGVPTYPD